MKILSPEEMQKFKVVEKVYFGDVSCNCPDWNLTGMLQAQLLQDQVDCEAAVKVERERILKEIENTGLIPSMHSYFCNERTRPNKSCIFCWWQQLKSQGGQG
jgi:hypothetical protein